VEFVNNRVAYEEQIINDIIEGLLSEALTTDAVAEVFTQYPADVEYKEFWGGLAGLGNVAKGAMGAVGQGIGNVAGAVGRGLSNAMSAVGQGASNLYNQGKQQHQVNDMINKLSHVKASLKQIGAGTDVQNRLQQIINSLAIVKDRAKADSAYRFNQPDALRIHPRPAPASAPNFDSGWTNLNPPTAMA
jgi:hypothetical protein